MSLPDRVLSLGRAAAAGLALLLASCTVQPLYGTGPTAMGPSSGIDLSSIEVAPVDNRVSQEVRNHLIFLLHGRASPAASRYTVGLNVSAFSSAAASIQVGRDEDPTAAVVTVNAGYVLIDSATGKQLAAGARSAAAPYDVSRQQFAALRAERDAQNRAARETAELLRLALAQELARLSTR